MPHHAGDLPSAAPAASGVDLGPCSPAQKKKNNQPINKFALSFDIPL
jgi:hypothetical protein